MCNKNKYQIKRYFLPFLGVFALSIFEEVRNFYYFPIVFTFGFFILFWNFPSLVYYTNTQPIYYEDLFVDKKKLPNYNVPEHIKNKFECIFDWTLITTSSLAMGLLADYWLYKTNNSNTVFEVLGVTGGILKLFQLINNMVGKVMLKIIKFKLKKEKEKYRRKILETRKKSEEILEEGSMKSFDGMELYMPKSQSSGTLSQIRRNIN